MVTGLTQTVSEHRMAEVGPHTLSLWNCLAGLAQTSCDRLFGRQKAATRSWIPFQVEVTLITHWALGPRRLQQPLQPVARDSSILGSCGL